MSEQQLDMCLYMHTHKKEQHTSLSEGRHSNERQREGGGGGTQRKKVSLCRPFCVVFRMYCAVEREKGAPVLSQQPSNREEEEKLGGGGLL